MNIFYQIKFILILLFISSRLCATNFSENTKVDTSQYEQSEKIVIPKLRLGIGYYLNLLNSGFDINVFYNDVGYSVGYGLSKTNNSSTNRIIEIENSLQLKISYSLAAWYGPFFYNPLYVGIGYYQVTENRNVLGFSGKGTIKGFQYFAGIRFLKDTRPFFKHLGGHIELGLNKWNYKESLLYHNNSGKKYNYPGFYFSMGLYYYIF